MWIASHTIFVTSLQRCIFFSGACRVPKRESWFGFLVCGAPRSYRRPGSWTQKGCMAQNAKALSGNIKITCEFSCSQFCWCVAALIVNLPPFRRRFLPPFLGYAKNKLLSDKTQSKLRTDLSAFTKPTFNAPLPIHQMSLFNWCSDAFRPSSALSSGSPVLTFEFSDTSDSCKHLSKHTLQNFIFHHIDAQTCAKLRQRSSLFALQLTM